MHPFLQSKTIAFWYAVASLAVSAAYCLSIDFVVGILPWQILVDTLVTGVLFCFEGLLLWLLLRFAIHDDIEVYSRRVNQLIVGFFVVVSIVGVEVLVMYSISTASFRPFATTIPIRILLVIMLYLLMSNYYNKLRDNKIDDLDIESEIEPLPLPESPIVESVEILDRISVKSGQKIAVINLDDVLFIKADGDYVSIVSKSGRWLKEQTMKYFEEHLPQNKFVRIHRSYIVNIEYITRIERYGQQQLVELKDGEKIKISSTGYKQLREKLNI